ncbi:MAG: polyprenyl synthetase family protein [Candidatus Zixiibacteriota bacterium]
MNASVDSLSADASTALREFWADRQARVEAEIERLLPPADADPARLHSAMRHAVLAGGKRLRPILTVATHEALGGSDPRIYTIGAAIELLHTYSLIHDDLPCMDDDDQRRGQPTVHVAYDEATAVLAGDALHALTFEILAKHAPLPIFHDIVHAIGTTGMLGGQMADLQAEGTVPTEELVIGIHRRKTGALLIASALAGARLAGVSEEVVGAIRRYAAPLGLAFQIVDDLLEVTGQPELLGKSNESDAKHAKVTYPGAVGVDRARQKADQLASEAISALADLPSTAETSTLESIARFVVTRDH